MIKQQFAQFQLNGKRQTAKEDVKVTKWREEKEEEEKKSNNKEYDHTYQVVGK